MSYSTHLDEGERQHLKMRIATRIRNGNGYVLFTVAAYPLLIILFFFFLFDSLHPIFLYPFLHHRLLDLSLSLDPVKHPKRCCVDRLLSAIGESGSDK